MATHKKRWALRRVKMSTLQPHKDFPYRLRGNIGKDIANMELTNLRAPILLIT